ncbi:ribonuclease H-like domain-containing protein [Tanacetum coccineum]|uniref:Ribonuclease H-like domain-containing protein n=1 Tax=Tanacetum coccineum TaxID=301880 RepID=A0ABQ4YJK7_9ASTR
MQNSFVVGGAIGARGSGIGDSLLVALYACMTFIYGSSWKGEMVSEVERSLDESSEGSEEVFPDESAWVLLEGKQKSSGGIFDNIKYLILFGEIQESGKKQGKRTKSVHSKGCYGVTLKMVTPNLVDTESKLGPDGDPVCDPTMFVAWQRIIRYVRGTLDHGLQLHLSTTTQLTKYTDADWAVRVLHVPSEFQYVDIFTKGLPSALFLEFCSSLNVQRPPVLREYFPNYY